MPDWVGAKGGVVPKIRSQIILRGPFKRGLRGRESAKEKDCTEKKRNKRAEELLGERRRQPTSLSSRKGKKKVD